MKIPNDIRELFEHGKLKPKESIIATLEKK